MMDDRLIVISIYESTATYSQTHNVQLSITIDDSSRWRSLSSGNLVRVLLKYDVVY